MRHWEKWTRAGPGGQSQAAWRTSDLNPGRGRTDKEVVVHIHNGISLGYKKEHI